MSILLMFNFLFSFQARADHWDIYKPRELSPAPSYPTYTAPPEPIRIDSVYGGSAEVRQGNSRVRCYESFGGSITCR